MKQAFSDVVGNEGLRRRLCDDVMKRSTAHAYILAGPHGSGKHTIARHFAAALACENREREDLPLPCLTCPTCKKILGGKSPDLLWIEKMGQSVKIEQIRALKTDVFTYPNDLDDKIYVIEDADTMTEAAQNAFLLTLEEPPSFVHFFLLCERPEKLLDTVRSRAPVLRTEILSRECIKDYLLSHSEAAASLARQKPSEFEELLTMADGSIGRGLELCDDKERAPLLKRRQLSAELVEKGLRKDYPALARLTVSLPRKRDELLPILNGAQSALRDLISLKTAKEPPLVFYTDREVALEMAYSNSTATLCALSDKLSLAIEHISRNANIHLALVSLLSKI
ncbi:MAG: hypothetical protein E7606_02620 [Ruminococcaceae bacterium]|nr:hypothetical protein [Oscillospiraceae bacterium]